MLFLYINHSLREGGVGSLFAFLLVQGLLQVLDQVVIVAHSLKEPLYSLTVVVDILASRIQRAIEDVAVLIALGSVHLGQYIEVQSLILGGILLLEDIVVEASHGSTNHGSTFLLVVVQEVVPQLLPVSL